MNRITHQPGSSSPFFRARRADVAVYALNGVYPNVADGLACPGGDLSNTEKMVTQMQLHS